MFRVCCWLTLLSVAFGGFTKCRIEEIPQRVLNCSSLQLREITKDMIEVTDTSDIPVTSIDLSQNYLKSVSLLAGSIFEKLNLSHNSISSFSDPLESVKVLDLSFNPLTFLNISGLLNLEEIYLESDNLSKLPPLSQLAYLQKLVVTRNCLSTLPELPESLKTLDLTQNSIEVLHPSPFLHTIYLESLILDGNPIIRIETFLFRHLASLEEFSCRDCKRLRKLPEDLAFSPHLRRLSLAGCNFTTLPHFFAEQMKDMETVELHDNPWTCNDSFQWITELKIPSESRANFRCSLPVNVTVFGFYQGRRHGLIIRYAISALTIFIILGLTFGLLHGYRMEMRRRAKIHPYTQLQQRSSPIYVSTVI